MKNLIIMACIIFGFNITCSAQLPCTVGQKISAEFLKGDYLVKGNLKRITDTVAPKLKYHVDFTTKRYTFDEKTYFPTGIEVRKNAKDKVADMTLMFIYEIGEMKNGGFYALRWTRGGNKKGFVNDSWEGTLWVFGTDKVEGYNVYATNNCITKIERNKTEDLE